MATPAKANRPVMGWQAPTVTTSSAARADGASRVASATSRVPNRFVRCMDSSLERVTS
jgi:hypothetical protein